MDGDLKRAWRRLKKKNGWDEQDKIVTELRGLMARLSPVPRDMAVELAEFFIPMPADEESVYKSEEILELLSGTWVTDNSILDDEDWDFIRELVNEWAVEMDMDIVTGVMRAVVDRGGFHDS